MNIFTKTKNNLTYSYYRKQREKAFVETKKHLKDSDDTEFRYWTNQYLKYCKKCLELSI